MDIVRIIAEDIGLPEEVIMEKFHSAEIVSGEKMLKVREQWRQGPSFDDDYVCNVISGDAEEMTGEERCEPYPFICYRDKYIIPRSNVVVVRCRRYNDTTSPPEQYIDYYVWHDGRWLRIRIYK